MDLNYGFPLPLIVNGKNLYITQTKFGIKDADGSSFIDNRRWYGMTDHDSQSNFLGNADNLTAIGEYDWDHADTQIGGVYEHIGVFIDCVCAGATDLEISYIQVEYYYD